MTTIKATTHACPVLSKTLHEREEACIVYYFDIRRALNVLVHCKVEIVDICNCIFPSIFAFQALSILYLQRVFSANS